MRENTSEGGAELPLPCSVEVELEQIHKMSVDEYTMFSELGGGGRRSEEGSAPASAPASGMELMTTWGT